MQFYLLINHHKKSIIFNNILKNHYEFYDLLIHTCHLHILKKNNKFLVVHLLEKINHK